MGKADTQRGSGSGSREGLLHEDVAQQLLRSWPLLGLHEYALEKVTAVVRHVWRQHRVRGLSGNFKYGRHGFKLGPRRALREHLHHCAAHAPRQRMEGKK